MGRDDLVARAAYQPVPTAVGAARRFVRDMLQTWAVPSAGDESRGLIDDAVLLTSELVTNAVMHAGTPVQVTCRLADRWFEVVVTDGYPAGLIPERRHKRRVPAERTSGRGLSLPAALASAWGVSYGRTAKAVWFRLGLAGSDTGPDSDLGSVVGADLLGWPEAGRGGSPAGPEGTTDADGQPRAGEGVLAGRAAVPLLSHPVSGDLHLFAPGSAAPVPDVNIHEAQDDGALTYDGLLASAVESARAVVNADSAYALMADEDGDLSLRASAGAMSLPDGPQAIARGAARSLSSVPPGVAEPSVVTVPFVVDGRVTGLLAAASAASRRFGDDEAARLQRLADRWGPQLERAQTRELERLRRGRIGMLAEARGLLRGNLTRGEAMAMAGRAAVPRLVRWCAVLVPSNAGLRTVYARHAEECLSEALTWLLDQVSDLAVRGGSSPPLPAVHGPAWRWPLRVPPGGQAPSGVSEMVSDIAWCYPLGMDAGVFAVGLPRGGRLPREPAQLVADLACRLGVALEAAHSSGTRADTTQAGGE